MESERQFHPEILSRRAEATLWMLAILSLAALILLHARTVETSPWYTVLVVLLVLLAASTTLGNWMDRKTVLTLRPGGLDFRNGLRNVTLDWDEVQEVQVFPTRWGKQAHVMGNDAHFSFRTMSELNHQGETRARMGFTQGEYLIEEIIRNSGLQEADQTGNSQYYARP